jgi:hypothetical protein
MYQCFGGTVKRRAAGPSENILLSTNVEGVTLRKAVPFINNSSRTFHVFRNLEVQINCAV